MFPIMVEMSSPLILAKHTVPIYIILIIVRVAMNYHIIQNNTKLVIKIVELGILNQELLFNTLTSDEI